MGGGGYDGWLLGRGGTKGWMRIDVESGEGGLGGSTAPCFVGCLLEIAYVCHITRLSCAPYDVQELV